MDPSADAPTVTTPHPWGARALITTAGLEEKPVLYIPEGAVSRRGLERGVVIEVGTVDYEVPFGPGDVVQYHPGHTTEIAGSGELKLINLDCIMAWEGNV
jgi:hypothetical protein